MSTPDFSSIPAAQQPGGSMPGPGSSGPGSSNPGEPSQNVAGLMKNKMLWIAVAAAVVMVIAISVLGGGVRTHTVPIVNGMSAAEAVQELESLGFSVVMKSNDGNIRDPEGRDALSTEPFSGNQLDEGERIILFVTDAP